MDAYLPYAQYKPSNVDWLGDIPEHWEVWKVTHGFNRIGSGTTPRSDNPAFYDGDIPWVTTSELRESIILDTAQKVTEDAVSSHSALKLYPEGSLAIAMYGATIGRLGMLGVDATFNQACCVFSDPTVFDTRFFYYWLWMRRPILISLSNGGGQPNLSQDDLKKLWIPVPDIDEQQAIARFLDFKTAQIDALIAKKKTLLEKLAEKRTALISHAVTKGLGPSVPMKDSGVEWLGEIPAHWSAKRIKHLTPVKRGASPRPIDDPKYFDEEGEFAWVRISDVSASDRFLEATTQRLSEIGDRLSVRIYPGSLFLSIAGTVGKPIITKIKCCIHDGFVYFPALQENTAFLYYIFSSGQPYLGLGKMGTQLNLNTDTVGSIKIGVPPRDEQGAIVAYLDKVTAKLDEQVGMVNRAIERLSEFRSTIITNAVTGKIDVRDFPIPDPVAKELCDA